MFIVQLRLPEQVLGKGSPSTLVPSGAERAGWVRPPRSPQWQIRSVISFCIEGEGGEKREPVSAKTAYTIVTIQGSLAGVLLLTRLGAGRAGGAAPRASGHRAAPASGGSGSRR